MERVVKGRREDCRLKQSGISRGSKIALPGRSAGSVIIGPPVSKNRGLSDFFEKNRRWCFLSCLVVTPPCHAWLSPLVVALTGSGKRRKILSGRT